MPMMQAGPQARRKSWHPPDRGSLIVAITLHYFPRAASADGGHATERKHAAAKLGQDCPPHMARHSSLPSARTGP
ncbi:hypothetical protein ABB26_14880 [Stenotrophomonas humi]|uniref:Uncharacterized protein n=1 Tax=Stenotrophomonas humi TaxID=405444 RepID=A0A0R0BZH0_9GAMM|nr:hypothetical protein ABB26_14880 [Stenotrophomonas humi]